MLTVKQEVLQLAKDVRFNEVDNENVKELQTSQSEEFMIHKYLILNLQQKF